MSWRADDSRLLLPIIQERISRLHRVTVPGSHLRGEQAHTLERLLVGETGQTSPEAEVVVGRLSMKPREALGDLFGVADEVSLPRQFFGSDRLRLGLVSVPHSA